MIDSFAVKMVVLVGAFAGACCLVQPAMAAEGQYTLRAGVSHTDNPEQLGDADEQPATAATAGLQLSGRRSTGRLRYDLTTDLSYLDYLDADVQSGVEGNAALAAQYRISRALRWNAQFSYQQLREDLTRSLSPGNREDLFSLSTGPTLLLRLGSTMEAELQGSYARTAYGERPFDNQSLHGRGLIARRLSLRSRVALGGSYADVDYLSPIPQVAVLDFNRREAFARLELEGVRTTLQVEAGYADARGQTVDDGGAMVRANVTRRVTPSLGLYLRALREYPTAEPASFSPDGSLPGGGYSSADLTAGPRLTESGEIGLRYSRSRTDASLGLILRRERAATELAQSRRGREISGTIARRVTPDSTLSLHAAISDERFRGVGGGEFDEQRFGARWNSRFGRAFGVELWGERFQRKSALVDGKAAELRGGINATWSGAFGRSGER